MKQYWQFSALAFWEQHPVLDQFPVTTTLRSEKYNHMGLYMKSPWSAAA